MVCWLVYRHIHYKAKPDPSSAITQTAHQVAGPDRVSMAELVQRYLSKTGDPHEVVADANARYYGLVLNDESLTPGANPRLGSTTFEQWVSTYKPRS